MNFHKIHGIGIERSYSFWDSQRFYFTNFPRDICPIRYQLIGIEVAISHHVNNDGTRLYRIDHFSPAKWRYAQRFCFQDGKPRGEDWQTWPDAMCLYMTDCVENKHTRSFDDIRSGYSEKC
ncbi:MAG: hypothetical protein PVI26_01130 [Chitinispirillia bacterium]